jgi:uncharacterized protein YndB with AHSA1/START domain
MIESLKPATVSLPSDHEIVITRSFDAPRDVVFDAWTKAEHVARWWDPSRVPLAHCEIDLRPNGAFRFEHQGHHAPGYVFTGTYREITRPSRLVFQTPSPSGKETIGAIDFNDCGERTQLTITMTCASKDDRDALLRMGVDAGTVQTLENLNDFLATTH